VRFRLDTLGSLLRSYGKHGFELDEMTASQTAERYERWARHVLTCAPRPDAEADGPTGVRAWRVLEHDFAQHRKQEHDHVGRIRSVVFEMMSGIREAFERDAAADARLRERLDKLNRLAASGGSVSELRKEIAATVVAIEESLNERQERHRREIRALGERLQGMKAELAAVRKTAETDALTKVYNRASLDRHLEANTNLSDFTGEPVTMLLLDLDHFKKLNDRYGHQAGDRVLQVAADTFVRAASRNTDFVARYGGEEFAIVLGDTPVAGGKKVAERILEAVRRLNVAHGGAELQVTVSIGVAQHAQFEPCSKWLARADGALYQAKQSGRDQVQVAQDP
jgi:diguanylate cyclase (GGDEF)-like protein